MKKKIFTLIIIVCLVMAVYYFFTYRNNKSDIRKNNLKSIEYEKHLSRINKIVAEIKPGLTRLEIEKQFKTRDGGIQLPTLTRYYEEPNTIIEVPYDENGGQLSRENRVNCTIKVSRGGPHID